MHRVQARVLRIGLLAAMAVVTLNIWLGAPLLGLWVGSKVAGDAGTSMFAIVVVVGTIGVAAVLLVRTLAVLGHTYDGLVGRGPAPRRTAPWLRSMRAERDEDRMRRKPTAPEYLLVGSVALVALIFEVWFFFLSGSSIG